MTQLCHTEHNWLLDEKLVTKSKNSKIFKFPRVLGLIPRFRDFGQKHILSIDTLHFVPYFFIFLHIFAHSSHFSSYFPPAPQFCKTFLPQPDPTPYNLECTGEVMKTKIKKAILVYKNKSTPKRKLIRACFPDFATIRSFFTGTFSGISLCSGKIFMVFIRCNVFRHYVK